VNPEVFEQFRNNTGLTIRRPSARPRPRCHRQPHRRHAAPRLHGQGESDVQRRPADRRRQAARPRDGEICVYTGDGAPCGCSRAITTRPRRPRTAGTTTTTTPATSPGATRTAISGTSAARTTSSSPPATASGRSRSKASSWSSPTSSSAA
jgi:hypothetical protein